MEGNNRIGSNTLNGTQHMKGVQCIEVGQKYKNVTQWIGFKFNAKEVDQRHRNGLDMGIESSTYECEKGMGMGSST